MSWFWPKVIWSNSGSLKRNVQYSCSVHIFLMEKHWNFLLHIKIAYDLRVFHPWLFRQVQGHWKELFKILLLLFIFIINIFNGESLKIVTLQSDCLWPKCVSWIWPKVIRASPRSVERKKKVHCLCPVYTFLK